MNIQQTLSDVASSLQRTSDALEALKTGLRGGRDTGQPGIGAANAVVNTWDDPFSEKTATDDPPLATPFAVPLTNFTNPRMQIAISGSTYPKGAYAPGTSGFRYWLAAEALARGIEFWSGILPSGTTWSTSNPMNVDLDSGTDLNARYFRLDGLRFYRGRVGSIDIYSAESPDVVCHELGHAVLDALKPQLFDHANMETSAFHEAFGDISAILSALQVKRFRTVVLEETNGSIQVNSRLSRLAEQLGWGLRRSGRSVDNDCLRNAANDFFYRPPLSLPASAPAHLLSSEPHSFSRVFSGAFLDILARIFKMASRPDEAALATAADHAARILSGAIQAAPVSPDYFSQVAAAMVLADQELFGGRYRMALTSALVQRGILTVGSGMTVAGGSAANAAIRLQRRTVPLLGAPMMSAGMSGVPYEMSATVLAMEDGDIDDGFMRGLGATPELPLHAVAMDGLDLFVHWAVPPQRFDVSPSTLGFAAAAPASVGYGPQAFVEGLITRGELDAQNLTSQLPFSHKSGDRATHEVTEQDGRNVVKRINFSCRCCHEAGI